METIWAPWRIEYICGEKEKGCVFCNALNENAALTLYQDALTMVVMNKYPYINGHLLVAPTRHLAGLDQLSTTEMTALFIKLDQSVSILKKIMQPDGFNVGLNLGEVAGAGMAEHLHFHIVPRWFGDTNALTVFADVRVIPEHIEQTFQNLKPEFDVIKMEA